MFIVHESAIPVVTWGMLLFAIFALWREFSRAFNGVESAADHDYEPLQNLVSACLVGCLVTIGAPLWMLYGPGVDNLQASTPLPARLALYCLAVISAWHVARETRLRLDLFLVSSVWSRPYQRN